MNNYSALIYSVDDGVAKITLNRPDRMNTMGGSMKSDLFDVFAHRMPNDRTIRCVVLTGVGNKAFCAGADIKERAGSALSAAEYHTHQKYTHDLTCLIEKFKYPVIAAINGVALGGGMEIALCADIRIAADHARFGLPEVNLGVMPAAGGTQRAPRILGASKAKELMFTGRMMLADEALACGLVSHVVPQAQLMDTALALAEELARKPPLSVAFIKHAVNAGLQVGMDAGLEYERLGAAMVMASDDRKEGMAAFIEKRPAIFKGS